MHPHRPPDETPTLPPISVLTTPYAFTPLPLPSLHLHSTLPTCLQHRFPSLCLRVPSRHASNTAYHPYASRVHSQHAPDTAYHPYARGVPSQHAPNTAYHPYAHLVPS
ncbi:hypothetical protein O181_084970 [Austropuccinia psidii MF-1]|uniref:Uncharacterized protein n=1 Tax=Austropuccinia psidii MF-1 TaxID=1389203 RepID=A0A9Q3FWN0_9BASI|nr:hypothetical protein [Austropuccinia psidii MF-1]